MADSNIIITSSVESLRRQNPNALKPDADGSGESAVSAGMDLSPLLEVSEQTLAEIRQINANFEEFFDKMELQRLRARDEGAPTAAPAPAAPAEKKEDDSGFLFDGIIMAFSAFKKRILDFAKRFKNFIKIIAKPFVIITAAVSGILGFVEGFTENEDDTMGEKITRGIMRGIEKILDTIVAWPAQLLVDAAAWLMRALGAESIADYLDKVDIRKALSDLFDNFEQFIEPIGSVIDSVISFFQSEEVSTFLTTVKETLLDGFNNFLSIIEGVMNTIFGIVRGFVEGETMGEKLSMAFGAFQEGIMSAFDAIKDIPKNILAGVLEGIPRFARAQLPDSVLNYAGFDSSGDRMVSAPGETTRETSSASLSEESRTAAAQNIMGQQSSVNVIDNSVSSTSNSSSSAAIMMEVPGATDRHDQYRGRNGYAFAS